MDGLPLRLQMKGSELPARFRELPGNLLRLIIEQPPHWEYLLFSGSLAHEISELADLKRDWRYGIVEGPCSRMTPRHFMDWFQTKVRDINLAVTNTNRILSEALPRALGPPGVSGDPGAILHCAKRLAGIYRTALEYRLDFGRVELHPELEKLKAAAARLSDNVVREVEDFSSNFDRDLKQAIIEARAGKKVEANAMLKLTSSGTEEYSEEVRRVTALCLSGALPRD